MKICAHTTFAKSNTCIRRHVRVGNHYQELLGISVTIIHVLVMREPFTNFQGRYLMQEKLRNFRSNFLYSNSLSLSKCICLITPIRRKKMIDRLRSHASKLKNTNANKYKYKICGNKAHKKYGCHCSEVLNLWVTTRK